MIRIAISGYGYLGRGVECAVEQNRDMELVATFTRRPDTVNPRSSIPVISVNEVANWIEKVDVLILCGSAIDDLRSHGPHMAAMFNTVDSFDVHPHIPAYYNTMNAALQASGKLGVISAGWDPGLFSLNRLYMSTVLPEGQSYTFWGKGISQGHSTAIRKLDGVLDGVQYTCPIESSIERVRSGAIPQLTNREKHTRECYVVLKEGVNTDEVEQAIITMPYYFADYETTVHFITLGELKRDHSKMDSRGLVFRSGQTGQGSIHSMEYRLDMDSNPEFTASVLVAYARAVYKMAAKGKTGAITVLDVAPSLLSAKTSEQLRMEIL